MVKQQFSGFPARLEFTPVPNLFLAQVMPQIEDISELKVTLYIMANLYRKRGYPRFITFSELLSDNTLMSGLKQETKSPAEVLRHALSLATERGTILHLRLDTNTEPEDIYLLNTEADKKIIDKIQQGKLSLKGLTSRKEPAVDIAPLPNIFTLYEQNIGMLTPMIADELQQAEKLYPAEWLESAFKEAVALNKRSWRYIARILEHWAAEGKDDGKFRRDFKKETDANKYIKGRYGHVVKR